MGVYTCAVYGVFLPHLYCEIFAESFYQSMLGKALVRGFVCVCVCVG